MLDTWKRQNQEDEEEILAYFANLESEDVYVTLQKALYAERKGNREDTQNAFEACILKKNLYLRYPLAYLGIRCEFEMSALIGQTDLQEWTEYAQKMAEDVGDSWRCCCLKIWKC